MCGGPHQRHTEGCDLCSDTRGIRMGGAEAGDGLGVQQDRAGVQAVQRVAGLLSHGGGSREPAWDGPGVGVAGRMAQHGLSGVREATTGPEAAGLSQAVMGNFHGRGEAALGEEGVVAQRLCRGVRRAGVPAAPGGVPELCGPYQGEPLRWREHLPDDGRDLRGEQPPGAPGIVGRRDHHGEPGVPRLVASYPHRARREVAHPLSAVCHCGSGLRLSGAQRHFGRGRGRAWTPLHHG